MFARFLSFICLWFSPSTCLSFTFIPLSVCPSLVLPLINPDLTLKVFCFFFPVNHTWSLPHVWALLFLGSAPSSMCVQERVALIIPSYWLLQHAGAVIYMRWHSVQTHRPSQPFSGKQLTAPLSALLPCTLLFSPQRSSSTLFLWLLSSHKHRRFTAKDRERQNGWGVIAFWLIGSYSSERSFERITSL